MPVEIRVPPLGESLVDAVVGQWLKAEGDLVSEGEPIVEIESAKATEQAPATASGRLVKILVPEGQTVETFTTLAVIAADGENYADLLV